MVKNLKEENEIIVSSGEAALLAKDAEFLVALAKLRLDLTGEENQNPQDLMSIKDTIDQFSDKLKVLKKTFEQNQKLITTL